MVLQHVASLWSADSENYFRIIIHLEMASDELIEVCLGDPPGVEMSMNNEPWYLWHWLH